jgi:hypothetical protein
MVRSLLYVSILCVSILCVVIGPGAALAQTSDQASPSAATAGQTDKQSISKLCSEQANAKGLHGKERRKFRARCKRKGGKST